MADRPQLQRWMTAAAEGDRSAIEPLFHALWQPLVGYATRFVGDAALAEDCVQEALTRLFGQIDRFDPERDALTWALTHTTWQCRTARRKVQRRAEAGTAPQQSVDGAPAAEHPELVRAAPAPLDSLPPPHAAIINPGLTHHHP